MGCEGNMGGLMVRVDELRGRSRPAPRVFGKGQIIHVRHDAVSGRRYLVGGSDPRGDGAAFGL